MTEIRTPIKKRRQRCEEHKASGRSWSEYVFGFIDYKGTEIWRCIKCKEVSDQWLIEYEIKKDKERRESQDNWRKTLDMYDEKIKARRKKMKDELWDCEVRDALTVGTKLRGDARRKFKQEIPKEVLQLARATIRLQNLTRDMKIGINQKNQDKRDKEKEELERKNRPLKKCITHGDLFLPDVIKSGKNRWTGEQDYKCRACMKIHHATHYKNNKEKVLAAHKRYALENPEKRKESRNKSWRKMNVKNREHETIER